MAPFDEEQIKFFVKIRERGIKNADAVADLFLEKYKIVIDRNSVYGVWEKKGLIEKSTLGGYRHGVPQDKFMRIYKENFPDGDKISELTGLKKSSIRARCTKSKLPYPVFKKTKKKNDY